MKATSEMVRRKVSLVFASVLVLSVVLVVLNGGLRDPAGSSSSQSNTVLRSLVSPGTYFDYFVIILMENHNLCDLYAHNPPCNPPGTATYMTSLADQYAISRNYHYGNVNPSLPNYLAISGGTDFGCANYDGTPHSNACTNAAWAAQNFVDLFEGANPSLTWKAYMQDMPTNPGDCTNGDSDSGNYVVRHNPFQYYSDIRNTPARCSRVVPSGPNSGSDATFLSNLGSTSTASNFMWLTPNNCNNMHSCSIGTGDTYLSNLVPQILNSNIFTTQRALLALVFDEGYSNPTWASFAGPVSKTAYTSSTYYDHYSLLKTIESNWGLPSLTSNDGNAAAMSEFLQSGPPPFTVDFTFTPTNPGIGQTVTFTATTSGGTPPITFAWTFGDGGTATGNPVTHAYSTSGSFTAQVTATDSALHTATKSKTVSTLTPKFCPSGYGITNLGALRQHSSILIDSNTLFDAAHGVRSGSGTLADPYIISDWYFDASGESAKPYMLRIEKTDKYVTIRNVFIFKMDSANQYVGLEIGEYPTDVTTKFVTIQNVNVEAKHAYGIGVRGGSDTITVKDSCVNLDANVDWNYGMVTMRNTRTVTFQHNYVNAFTSSSTYHTVGIHLSDFWISDAQSATGIVADNNLIENATASGIISESSSLTEVKFNKIYHNYPGMKVVDINYPRGIQVQQKSVNASVHDNEIYKVHWGIQIGADYGRYYNNKIHDSDWGVYILNNGAWGGISSNYTVAYNTVAWSIVNQVYRLPDDANHDSLWIVDIPNSGVTPTDFSKILTKWPAASPPTAVEYEVKSGGILWVRVTFPAPTGLIFDVSSGFSGAEIIKVTYSVPSGQSMSTFTMTTLTIATTTWSMTNSAVVTFAGTGFTPNVHYALKKSGAVIQCLTSTGTGGLSATIAAGAIATYDLIKGGC